MVALHWSDAAARRATQPAVATAPRAPRAPRARRGRDIFKNIARRRRRGSGRLGLQLVDVAQPALRHRTSIAIDTTRACSAWRQQQQQLA